MPGSPPLFSLATGRWYAMQFHGDEFGPDDSLSYSPIRVEEVRPLKTGKGLLELTFFHENYPEGVQGKRYRLHVVARDSTFVFARRVDQEPARYLMITELTWSWLRKHFGIVPREGDADVQSWKQSQR